MGVNKTGLTANQCNIGMREQRLYTPTKGGKHLVLALDHLLEVEVVGQVAQSKDIAFLKRLHNLSIAGKRLGGYATFIQTGAANMYRLEDDHLQAALGCMTSGAVATRPRADND